MDRRDLIKQIMQEEENQFKPQDPSIAIKKEALNNLSLEDASQKSPGDALLASSLLSNVQDFNNSAALRAEMLRRGEGINNEQALEDRKHLVKQFNTLAGKNPSDNLLRLLLEASSQTSSER